MSSSLPISSKARGSNVGHGVELTASELMRAEDLWVRESQRNFPQHKSFRAWE